MSLDLSGKAGVAYGLGAITAATGFNTTLFDAVEQLTANRYVVKVDTSGGNVDLSSLALPSTMNSFLKDGDEVTFIKGTADVNRVIVDDTAATGGANFNHFTDILYNYVNQPGESITLLVDMSNDKWGVQI